MGWQTNVITKLEFNKETYNSTIHIEEDIDSNNKIIQNIIEELSVMAVTRPKDLLLHNEEMDLLSLQRKVKDKIGLLKKCYIENYKLRCLKENFNLRNGDFIHNYIRRYNIKKWLLDNYILKQEDLNMDIDDAEHENDE